MPRLRGPGRPRGELLDLPALRTVELREGVTVTDVPGDPVEPGAILVALALSALSGAAVGSFLTLLLTTIVAGCPAP